MKYFKKKIEKPLGQLLIEGGVITKKQLEEALGVQSKEGGLIGEVIVSLGFAREEEIAYALSLQYGFPYLPLQSYDIPKALLTIIPKQVACQYCFIPIDKIGNTLTVAMSNPLNPQALDDIEYLSKCEIQIFVATSSDIRVSIEEFYSGNKPESKEEDK